jgi:parallel beta helix pectate lyase-like protein
MRTLGWSVAAVLGLFVGAARADVLLVCNSASCPAGFTAGSPGMFASLSAAAAAVRDGDTILVWPGTYPEEVIVDKSDVTVRGMDRYGVVLDGGTTRGVGLQAGRDDGSVIVRNVTFENMSGGRYRSHTFFWVNTRGYFGRYLTGYNNIGYGVYAFQSSGDPLRPSEMKNSYASGNADSGFYIGGCIPCNAVIDTVWAENNALGYSGTNAGGNLVIQNSEWDENITGILPNTLPSEPAGPQRGIVIKGNVVHDNNNASAPADGLTGLAPLGTGIGVAGGSQNQIFGNTVYNHKHYGIALFWLETPARENQVFDNTLYANGDADLLDDGGGSVNNCFSENVDPAQSGGEATSSPPALQTTSSCSNPAQGSVATDPTFVTNVAGVTEPRTPADPFALPAQPGKTPFSPNLTPLEQAAVGCMPNPCAGIPDNAFCSAGEPVAGAKSAACS